MVKERHTRAGDDLKRWRTQRRTTLQRRAKVLLHIKFLGWIVVSLFIFVLGSDSYVDDLAPEMEAPPPVRKPASAPQNFVPEESRPPMPSSATTPPAPKTAKSQSVHQSPLASEKEFPQAEPAAQPANPYDVLRRSRVMADVRRRRELQQEKILRDLLKAEQAKEPKEPEPEAAQPQPTTPPPMYYHPQQNYTQQHPNNYHPQQNYTQQHPNNVLQAPPMVHSPTKQQRSGLSTGHIIAIVAVAIGVLVVIFALLMLCLCYPQEKSTPLPPPRGPPRSAPLRQRPPRRPQPKTQEYAVVGFVPTVTA